MAGCLSKAEQQMPVVQQDGKGGDPWRKIWMKRRNDAEIKEFYY